MHKKGWSGYTTTALQLIAAGRVPKDGAQPVELWTNQYCGRTAMYYRLEDTREATDEEKGRLQKAVRDRRNARRRELYREHKAEEARRRKEEERWLSAHTAWQWLSQAQRVPKAGAKPFKKWPERENDQRDFVDCRTRWWYYAEEDTREATDAEYDRLKDLYIKRFGGWEEIDLDHTAYDGRIWWEEDTDDEKTR